MGSAGGVSGVEGPLGGGSSRLDEPDGVEPASPPAADEEEAEASVLKLKATDGGNDGCAELMRSLEWYVIQRNRINIRYIQLAMGHFSPKY